MNNSRYAGAMVALGILVYGCGGSRAGNDFVPGPVADFRSATTAEVRNAQTQVILTGKFVETAADADEIERKATLAGTGIDADASGAVEVESCRDADCKSQEIEFEVVNVEPGTVLKLVIDGKDFATVIADSRGRAAVERNVPLPR
jgi:hypothetical protein